ncbi:MAG: hypothetical protein IT546_01625 [Caulobacteraceae bacterium]|nr:hypothetical protein [Caulobacteraceae bacterium]
MTDNFTGESARESANGGSLHIAETAEKVFARAQETYQDVRAKAKVRFGEADTMMRERPYVALGLAAFAGFLLGHIISSGRPNVVYLKDGR